MTDTTPTPESATPAPAAPADTLESVRAEIYGQPAVETEAPSEKPAEKVETTSKPEDKDSHKHVYFKRREKELKSLENELQKKQKELQDQLSEIQNRQKLKKENIINWLEAEGVSPDDFIQAAQNQGKPKDAATRDLEERLERFEKLEAERQQSMLNQQTQQLVEKVVSQIKTDERFELINSSGSHDAVIDKIVEEYNQGNALTWEQAAESVEAELNAGIETLLQTKKGRLLLEKLLPQPQQKVASVKQPTKTMTQSYDAPVKSDDLTPEERSRMFHQLLQEINRG